MVYLYVELEETEIVLRPANSLIVGLVRDKFDNIFDACGNIFWLFLAAFEASVDRDTSAFGLFGDIFVHLAEEITRG
jgi:hypothetical protein